MKKYFVKYYGFSNVYDLVYTTNKEQEKQAEKEGYERITRKKAEHLCAMEKERRKYDQAFSYYAATIIAPFDYDEDKEDIYGYNFAIKGYIAERK